MPNVEHLHTSSQAQQELDLAVTAAIQKVAARYRLTPAEVAGVLEVVKLRQLLRED
jgi:hypothetical protein